MKKLALTLLVVLSALFASCEEFDNDVWIPFQIQKGEHFCNRVFINRVITNSDQTKVDFDFYFPDTSYIYDIGNNQSDWNKLFGITPFVNSIHEYSIRVVWRYFWGQLQIGYYIYLPDNPKVIKGFLTTTSYDIVNHASIIVQDGCISVSVNEEIYVYWDGDIDSCPGWYTSMPYFGGDEVAPHDINIALKCKYLTECLNVQL